MNEDKPLIQRGDEPAHRPWYKRKVPIIVVASAAVVVASVVLLVAVISIVRGVP